MVALFSVIVSGRRKNETGFSIETLCHDPSLPLYGVMLDDYNSSACEMKEKNTTHGPAHFCSCTEEECNDKLSFSPGECHQAQLNFHSCRMRSNRRAFLIFWQLWGVFHFTLLLFTARQQCFGPRRRPTDRCCEFCSSSVGGK